MKIDRRVQKTKKLLSNALIELILLKGYENVTIQDILDKANVGRSTFYTHYENKDLLLIDGPKNLGISLFGDEAGHSLLSKGRKLNFLPMFLHVGENLPLAKAMFGEKSGDIIINSFRVQIAMSIKNHYKNLFFSGKREKLKLTYLSSAAASAVTSLLVSWVDDSLEISAEDITEQAHKMLDGIFK